MDLSGPSGPVTAHKGSLARYIQISGMRFCDFSVQAGAKGALGWSTPAMCSAELLVAAFAVRLTERRAVGAPRQFRSTEHLSIEAVAAYADGELPMKAYLRAAHHLSLCSQCAAEVEGQGRPVRSCATASRWWTCRGR